MLCAFEPVRRCRTLPNWSGSTTRRSICSPVWVRARAKLLSSPEECSTMSISPSARSSAGGSDAVAMTSRSLTASTSRRAEPASSTRSAAGCSRSAATIASPTSSALCSSVRGRGASATPAANACRTASSNLGPKPLTWRSCSVSAAARQAHHVDQPGRELRAQLLGGRDRPGVEQRDDLLLERAPDPGQLRYLALARQRGHRARRLAHGLRRVAVGEDAVYDGAVELVEVGQLVEEGGDRGVGWIGRHGRRTSLRGPP